MEGIDNLGKLFKYIRVVYGLTQKQFSEESGISQGTIKFIETNKNKTIGTINVKRLYDYIQAKGQIKMTYEDIYEINKRTEKKKCSKN